MGTVAGTYRSRPARWGWMFNVQGNPTWRFVVRAVLLPLAPFVLSACGSQPKIPLAERCNEQIMLSLSPGVGRTDRVMEGLEEDARVHLEFLRSAGPTLHVYTLTAKGRDPGCVSALSRLRQESNVRFAEPERRRAIHGFVQ